VALAILALAVVAAGGGYVARAITETRHSSNPASAGQSCSGSVQVPVVVAPELASAVRNIAADWSQSKPDIKGSCATARVSAAPPAQAVTAVARATGPMVWIPDSSVWVARFAAAHPGLVAARTSVASSPLVAATSAANTAKLQAEARSGWAGVLGGKLPVVINDPATNASGAVLTVAVAQASSTESAGASQATMQRAQAQVVGLFLELSRTALATPVGGFAKLTGKSAPVFVTTERDMHASGNDGDGPKVAAVNPAGMTPALDYPAVQIVPHGAGAVQTAAAAAFAQALRKPAAVAQFVRAGLRDPQCDPTSVDKTPVQLAPAPTAADRSLAQRLWTAAVRPAQLLVAMDVSGSMNDPAQPGGKPKIDVAAQAAEKGVALLPDDWRVGIWSFSTQPPPANDWTELAPLGQVGTTRSQLIAADASLPQRVGGDTALYETARAAFEDVRRHYVPGDVNTVVLFTDGSNVDPGDDLTLHGLVKQLRDEYDPAKPVRIVTIGFGHDADTAALHAISSATHGQSYHVDDPAQIQLVLLDAILANNQ
jgi:hypothetical protein